MDQHILKNHISHSICKLVVGLYRINIISLSGDHVSKRNSFPALKIKF